MHFDLFIKVSLPVLDGPARILREVRALSHLIPYNLPPRTTLIIILLRCLLVVVFRCRLHKCSTGSCLVLITVRYGLKVQILVKVLYVVTQGLEHS